MTAHSPGPWRWNARVIGVERLVAPDGGAVLEVSEDGGTFHLSPDGRLIAAAPDLLKALVREHVHRLEGPVGRLPSAAWDEHAASCEVCALIDRTIVGGVDVVDIPKLVDRGVVGCEKCTPGIAQAWFRCPKCGAQVGAQRAALIERIAP